MLCYFFYRPGFYHCPLYHDIITLSYKIYWSSWPNDVSYVSVTYHRCPFHKQRLTGIMNLGYALVFTTMFFSEGDAIAPICAQFWVIASKSNQIPLPCVYEIAYPCLKSCYFICWFSINYILSSRRVWQHLLLHSLRKNIVFWLKFLFVAELCNWQDVCQLMVSIANTLKILQSSTKPTNW